MTERRRRDLLTPLLFALTVILLLAFWVFRPFLLVFAVAACVALLLAPAQKRLSRALGRRPTLAAALLVLVTTVLILVPVLTSLFLLARQLALFLDWIRVQPLLGPEELQRFWEQLPQRYPGLRAWISWLQAQVTPVVSGSIEQLAGGANILLQNVLGRVTHAALDLGLFLLHALLPAARRRAAAGRAAADLPLLGGAGAADLRPPRADHPGRPAGRGGGAGGAGHPRRDRLHDVRRAAAVRLGHRGHPRRHRPPRGLSARLDPRLPVPGR